jgi:hypothetical protein
MSGIGGYRHTQQAGHTLAMIVGFLVALALAGIIMALTGDDDTLHYAILAVVVGSVAAAGYLFASLTVSVEGRCLAWHFGPGHLKRSVALDEICEAVPVTNPWYFGWGVHLTPFGWLYNVSGFEAVEVRLKSGKRFRLGSDEPTRLAAAIRVAARRAGGAAADTCW